MASDFTPHVTPRRFSSALAGGSSAPPVRRRFEGDKLEGSSALARFKLCALVAGGLAPPLAPPLDPNDNRLRTGDAFAAGDAFPL